MTPLSASRPSTRAGGNPVSVAISFAMRTAEASATASTRRPRTPSGPSSVSEAWIEPRLKRSLASMRAGGSMPSKPGGVRRRRSRPRPLTLLASQRQRAPSRLPCASANPVMLTMAIATPICVQTLAPVVMFRKLVPVGRTRRRRRRSGVFDRAPSDDVLFVLGDGRGEDMPAGSVGDEIEIVRSRRVEHGRDGVLARIADRRRRQAGDRHRCCRAWRGRARSGGCRGRADSRR